MIKGKLTNNQENKENNQNKHDSQNTQTLTHEDNKLFQKFTMRDIVFLAIVSAALIVTCAVMPLVASLTDTIFGISQLVTGFQMAFFTTIGIMKLRKPFTMTIMLLFMGSIMFLMSTVMGISNLFVAFVVELLVILVFKGYKKNIACIVAGAIAPPLSLVVPLIGNKIMNPHLFDALVENVWIVIGMTFAVVAVGVLGATLGALISKELGKAGVLKKR